jgi:hypothetical protein
VLGACASAELGSSPDAIARCSESQACDFKTPAGVVLTPVEECQVSYLERRCNAVDRCLAECLRSGKQRRASGGSGCYHQCGNVLVQVEGGAVRCEWTAPVGFEVCAASVEEPSE